MGIARAQLILENVERLPHDIPQAMFDAFMRFEVQYLECIDDVTAGSCALTVVLQDDTLHVANCGDCRAVLYKVKHTRQRRRNLWEALQRKQNPNTLRVSTPVRHYRPTKLARRCLACASSGAQTLTPKGFWMLMQASGNKTVSITRDHSPDEESELLRIELAGGKVTQEVRQVRTACCGLWVRPSHQQEEERPSHTTERRDMRGDGPKWMTGPYAQTKEIRGAARVQPGSLAVSRSLGDCTLKSMHDPPIIITDPETFQVRECERARRWLCLPAPPTHTPAVVAMQVEGPWKHQGRKRSV
jgi:hypothetical protein